MTLKSLFSYTAIISAGLLVSCGGGGGGGNTVTPTPPTPPAADTTSPTVAFSPTTLTVNSGATGASTLTATDNIGVTSGPTVSCTSGGAFANNVFTAPAVNAETTSVCTATASDAAGNSGSATLTVTINAAAPPPGSVEISGKITFDSVPFNTATNGLNYNAITQEPARGITVEAINAAGTVLDSDVSNASGNYSVDVSSNTNVRIRAKAEMISTATAKWNVKTTDNTAANGVYAIQGSLTSSGAADSTRNLNAASGWGGASYTSTRAAAPFAILNPIYDTVNAFAAVDPDIDLPAMEFRWSESNRSENGDRAMGQIGTSSYVRLAGETQGNVYILGDADGADNNDDTDEYDTHVVVHEWGHYFEDRMSRSDSVGGAHSGGDRLDPRVALGEGWGNALSGMITGDPFYRDSSGTGQSRGFFINVDNNNNTNPGWYSEGSVQSILFDLFDSDDDGSDNISLGLGPIYQVFTSPNYTGQTVFTTIFGFIDELNTQQPANAASVNALVGAQNIDGTGTNGTGETNAGGVTNSLPIYSALTVNGAAVNICSNVTNGTYNKLGNRQYLTVNIPSAGAYTLTMTKTSGAVSRDPDFNVFRGATFVAQADSGADDTESLTQNLQAGAHVIDAYEYNNIDPGSTGESCFNFTITG